MKAASFKFIFKHHPAWFRLYWCPELLVCGEWNETRYFEVSACSCSIEEFYRRAEWWVTADRHYRTFQASMCVFLCTCFKLYACGGTSCDGVGSFFSQPISCLCETVLLYVRLSNDAPCYEKRPHPFQNMIPHLHAWLQHLVNIQPLVPGTCISFFFCYCF